MATPYYAPLSDDGFTGASAAPTARAPNPWDAPPYNGNVDAWMSDEVRSGRNFSTWLDNPTAAAAYQRYRAGRDQAQADRMASPEYQEMVRRESAEREAAQRAARASTGSGFSLSNIARAAAGTAAIPVLAARELPGVREVVDYTPAGLAQQGTQLLYDAALPGGSGLTRRQGGVVNRVADRAGIVDSPDQGDLPYTANTGGADPRALEAARAARAPGGPGLQVGAAIPGAADASERARGMRDFADPLLGQATGGAVGNTPVATDAGRDLTDQYGQRVDGLLGDASAGIAGLYGDAFRRVDEIETDPNRIYDRMLASQLAAASTTAGGAAAQRAAAFETAQNAPGFLASAEEQVRAGQVQKAQLWNDLTTNMSDDQLQVVQQGMGAAAQMLDTNAQFQQLGLQLDSAERMWMGNLALDIQRLAESNELAWAGLSQEERLAALQAEMQKYGIDRQLEGILAGIAAGSEFNWKNVAGVLFGGIQAYAQLTRPQVVQG